MKNLVTKSLIVAFCLLQFASVVCASETENLIKEMVTAYSTGGKGVQSPDFIAKVGEIDEHLRQTFERDHDITPFKELLTAANQLKARQSARKMFEVVLEKAYKRLQFTKAQQDAALDEETSESVTKMIASIERYLDPSLPDLDTVDRKGLENQRTKLQGKVRKAYENLKKLPEEKRIKVEVMREDGSAGKLSPARETNLLAKLSTVIPEPGKMKVAIKLLPDRLFDMEIFVQTFVAPNGFSVVEAELGFSGISLEALDDSNATEVENVLGDSYFRRYRIVQDEEQLNVMPQVGEAAYEMGSLAPGQSWKMPFKSTSNFSSIIKELDGNTDIAVINEKTAVSEKAIEFKNNGSRNLIFLQGTDVTGLVSVKAIGFLVPKKGQVTFREALMIVDDAISSDITSYIGGQGINWFLKKGSDNLRKGLPFTPVLENINMDRDESGKMVYVFSGRGKVAR
ncbi:MAG: hypothetical protein CVV41_09245 [Candidatus Riflebacteria bacterium HGW-Riflebacteria-1]|jgi:hypothetical protein|nr:MAG: hypothetical protein CVV41_09245 [Candidatus Riflebacteria bacterium HGW-Riflebacteria-1]